MSDVLVEPCSRCELPLVQGSAKAKRHAASCIGQTPYVLHNRKAGMVVYLSEEEWTAIQNSNQTSVKLPEGMAASIASRAVFGLSDGFEEVPGEG